MRATVSGRDAASCGVGPPFFSFPRRPERQSLRRMGCGIRHQRCAKFIELVFPDSGRCGSTRRTAIRS